MQPLVSVLIPHFSTPPDWLVRAVRSILDQDLPDLEVMLADDASPDDRWLAAVAPLASDPRVRLFRADRNVGPYRLKNRLLALARGRWIALQDADDWSRPSRLRLQLRVARRCGAGLVGSCFSYVDSAGRPLRRKRMVRHVNLWIRLHKAFVLLHPTSLISAALLRELGGFDGRARVGGDDDFLLRAVHRTRIRNLQRDVYAYRAHPAALTARRETGWGSTVRERYIRDLLARDRSRWWGRRLLSKARPEDLWARPIDREFELEALTPATRR